MSFIPYNKNLRICSNHTQDSRHARPISSHGRHVSAPDLCIAYCRSTNKPANGNHSYPVVFSCSGSVSPLLAHRSASLVRRRDMFTPHLHHVVLVYLHDCSTSAWPFSCMYYGTFFKFYYYYFFYNKTFFFSALQRARACFIMFSSPYCVSLSFFFSHQQLSGLT